MGRIAAWIGCVLFGSLALVPLWFMAPTDSSNDHIEAFFAAACLAAAAIFLFPPLWGKIATGHWKRFGVIAAILVAAIALTLPLKTRAVKLDMPSSSDSR